MPDITPDADLMSPEKSFVPSDIEQGEPELTAEDEGAIEHTVDKPSILPDDDLADLANAAAGGAILTDKDRERVSNYQGKMFAGIPIATVSQVKPFVNVLIYGLPGSGKTHVAATGAESKHLAPMLYVNAEAGANTLLKFRSKVGDNIMVVPDPQVQSGINWEQFEAVYDELDRQCYNTKDGPDFRTVCIDTGTELQKINMDWVMARTMKQHPDRDPDVPGLHDWGASTNRMRKYMRLFRNLPMNFIFLCHETTERDNKGVMWKRPDLPGKMANQVAGLFDQAMYLYTKEGDKGDESKATIINRYLLTGALEGYVTKDRSGNLPLVVANPNMNDIFELIHS
jgi:hypothetical protein